MTDAEPAAPAEHPAADPAARRAWPRFGEASAVSTRVALLSFGGPAGQIGVMHRIVVEEKRWLGDERFLHAAGVLFVLPGMITGTSGGPRMARAAVAENAGLRESLTPTVATMRYY